MGMMSVFTEYRVSSLKRRILWRYEVLFLPETIAD
jgi:hypothetical protein